MSDGNALDSGSLKPGAQRLGKADQYGGDKEGVQCTEEKAVLAVLHSDPEQHTRHHAHNSGKDWKAFGADWDAPKEEEDTARGGKKRFHRQC